MSDSKLGAQARGQRNLVPEVLDKAPAGTELGWVVWVANPSSGGGGTVDQGKKGSSGESWYFQDGSGLLATAAKQPALGTAGSPSADVISVQGVSGGTPQPVSPQARSATPAASFVNASASSVTLLAANASRKSASFFNNSNADLYLLETGGTADTTTGFTTILRAAGGWHELPIGADGSITTGAITGIWASAGISGVAVCERV